RRPDRRPRGHGPRQPRPRTARHRRVRLRPAAGAARRPHPGRVRTGGEARDQPPRPGLPGPGRGPGGPARTSRLTAYGRRVDMAHQWRGVITEYADRLPPHLLRTVVTLREGGTPLILAAHLSELVGAEVHLKYEGLNPTGSFKDRGMTTAISAAVDR